MTTKANRIPQLEGDALGAVEHRAGHLQIVASAGAGKTEVVAQRVAALLAEGVDPSAIVAFTFTDKAAASLKSRIDRRAVRSSGRCSTGSERCSSARSTPMPRLLQVHVPRFEVYDVLDDHRLTAFLTREAYRLGIADLGVGLYSAIASFASSVQVIENELIDERRLSEPFRGTYRRYCKALHASRLLTYGQFIVHAVRALQDDESVRHAVHSALRHLIVDEYQDINPAQEALVAAMVGGGAHLCVVGDDQQCIFQWRGSTVSNIRTFHERYRRSRHSASRPTGVRGRRSSS